MLPVERIVRHCVSLLRSLCEFVEVQREDTMLPVERIVRHCVSLWRFRGRVRSFLWRELLDIV